MDKIAVEVQDVYVLCLYSELMQPLLKTVPYQYQALLNALVLPVIMHVVFSGKLRINKIIYSDLVYTSIQWCTLYAFNLVSPSRFNFVQLSLKTGKYDHYVLGILFSNSRAVRKCLQALNIKIFKISSHEVIFIHLITYVLQSSGRCSYLFEVYLLKVKLSCQ